MQLQKSFDNIAADRTHEINLQEIARVPSFKIHNSKFIAALSLDMIFFLKRWHFTGYLMFIQYLQEYTITLHLTVKTIILNWYSGQQESVKKSQPHK